MNVLTVDKQDSSTDGGGGPSAHLTPETHCTVIGRQAAHEKRMLTTNEVVKSGNGGEESRVGLGPNDLGEEAMHFPQTGKDWGRAGQALEPRSA